MAVTVWGASTGDPVTPHFCWTLQCFTESSRASSGQLTAHRLQSPAQQMAAWLLPPFSGSAESIDQWLLLLQRFSLPRAQGQLIALLTYKMRT